MTLRFFKSTSTLEADYYVGKKDGKFIVQLRVSPTITGSAHKGQPKEGEHIYDYEKSIKMAFPVIKLPQLAFKLYRLAGGDELEIKEFTDPTKGGHEGSGKRVVIKNSQDSKGNDIVSLFISEGDNKINFSLDLSEAYTLAKWLELTFQLNYMIEADSKLHPKVVENEKA